jgi:hypothetical protein
MSKEKAVLTKREAFLLRIQCWLLDCRDFWKKKLAEIGKSI